MTRVVVLIALAVHLAGCSIETCTTYLVRPSFLALTAPTTSCVTKRFP
jgi:hypothetical protein